MAITYRDAAGATVTLLSVNVAGTETPGHHIADPTTPAQKLAVNSSGQAAVALADGAAVTLGAKADSAATTDTGTFTLIALFKRLLSTYFAAGLKMLALQGAANAVGSQVSVTTASTALAVARATRRSLTIKNTDATNPIYVSHTTATNSNGMPLKAGESITVTWVGAIAAIATGGTVVTAIWDEYD